MGDLPPIAKGRAIYGIDELRALLLAIRMCAHELGFFEERGGVIEHPPGPDARPGPRWDPSATFGALLRPPGR